MEAEKEYEYRRSASRKGVRVEKERIEKECEYRRSARREKESREECE